MKYGICEWILPLNLKETFKFAQETGMNGVAIGIKKNDKNKLNIYDINMQKDLLELCDEYSMQIPNFALNFLCDFSITNPDNELLIKNYIKDIADIAKKLNVPTLMIPSFRESDIRNEDDYLQTVRVLNFTCEYCEKIGMKVGWENAVSAKMNIDMVKNIDKPNFFIYFDTQNPIRMKSIDNVALAKEVKQYVQEMHAKDSYEDENITLCLGEGVTKFDEVMNVFADSNEIEWVLLESYYKVYENYKELICKDLEHVKGFFR